MQPSTRVLVTGSSGYLGSRVVDVLREGAHRGGALVEVVGLDRAPGHATSATIVADLTDPDARTAIPWDRLDAVVHLAAMTTVACERDFDAARALNIDATIDLLQHARSAGERRGRPLRFVFASSVGVFAGGADVVDESSAAVPRSTYGFTKVVAECHVAEHARRGFVDAVALRLPVLMVRPGRRGRTSAGFLSDLVRVVSQGERFVCPLPLQRRLPVASVDTAAHALADLAVADAGLIPATLLHLPALSVHALDAVHALQSLGVRVDPDAVVAVPDAEVDALVQGWPEGFESRHRQWADAWRDGSLETIVGRYLREHRLSLTPSTQSPPR